MFIRRDTYLEKLIEKKHNGLIKVITGLRRSGKSVLLFRLFREHLLTEGIAPEQIIEVQLDNIRFAHLRNPIELYEYLVEQIDEGRENYIFLDEIQYVEDFADVLNGLLYLHNVDVYVTGSNSRFLSTDILTQFRGRGDEVRVHPFSFAEFFSSRGGEFEEALDEYLVYGGLPRILSLRTGEQKSKFLKDLFQETYLKDIIERNRIRNVEELEELVQILASSIGSLTNPQKLENTFRSVKKSNLSRATISQYIHYLREAFILDEARRYSIKGKKYINSPFKYYFTDTGVRNALLGFRQIEETHLMENIIFNELKIRGFDVDVGIIEVREEDKEGVERKKLLEVDFIAHLGSKKYYLQSAYLLPSEEKKFQEKRPLRKIGDNFKKIIIVRNTQSIRRDEDGIVTLSLKEFLLEPDSLYR